MNLWRRVTFLVISGFLLGIATVPIYPAQRLRAFLWRTSFNRARMAEDPEKGWVSREPHLMEMTPTNRGARFRDRTGLSWFYGRISHLAAMDPAYPWLQIQVLARQGPMAVMQVSNLSYKGCPFGVLFRPGVYTFPVYKFQKGWEEKKEFALTFHGFGSSPGLPPKAGPWMELGWARLAREPADRLELELKKNPSPGKAPAGVLSVGDSVRFTAHLSAPAKDVTVEIFRPIYGYYISLTGSPYIQLYAADKTRRKWTADVKVSPSAGPKRTFAEASLEIAAVVVDGPVPAVGTSNPWKIDLR